MGATLKICRKRTTCAVLATGVVISLTALTGGVAPAFAKPGDEPVVPTTTAVAPAPATAPTREQAPAERPTAADVPTAAAPSAVTPVAPEATAEAPVQTRAPQPEPTAEAPAQTRAPQPTQSAPSSTPPVSTVAPSPRTTVTSTTASPSSEAPATTQPSATPSATTPSSAAPTPPSAALVAPTSSTPGEPTTSGSEPTTSGSEPTTSVSGPPSEAARNGTEGTPDSSGTSSPASSTTGSPVSSESGAPEQRVIQRVEPQTLQAPEQDVLLAKSAAVVEEKPEPAPAQDIRNISNLIGLPNADRDRQYRDDQWRADQYRDDRGRSAGDRGWDRNVRQWRPDWVQYDEYYRPVLSNPYRDPVRIVYIYQNAPRTVFIPPLARIALEVAQFAAYSFTAVVQTAVSTVANVAVGSFFGGGYFPGVGLPPPPPPPALVNYANVPVQVRYPDATYQPFRVSKIIDVGDDAQYGERKVLLDGVTPAWGQWNQGPSGERSFEVHKTQQFPGLDDPRPGPLPGDYQLTLASDETPSGMTNRDVYLVAVAVACGVLSIGAVVLAVVMGRRRRPQH